MSVPAAGKVTGQRFQRTYVTLASLNLSKVYIRDTVMVDDTGAQGPSALLLPKIGTAYAPVGKRVTVRKPSFVNSAIALSPTLLPIPDSISADVPGAFPSFGVAGAANSTALPAGVANSVTIEATDMSVAAGAQPSLTGGTPTTAGAWMIVASSVASV